MLGHITFGKNYIKKGKCDTALLNLLNNLYLLMVICRRQTSCSHLATFCPEMFLQISRYQIQLNAAVLISQGKQKIVRKSESSK